MQDGAARSGCRQAFIWQEAIDFIVVGPISWTEWPVPRPYHLQGMSAARQLASMPCVSPSASLICAFCLFTRLHDPCSLCENP